LPRKIKDAPELLPGLEIYHRAFNELSSTRQNTGFGPGAIPWTAINDWAIRHGLGKFEDFQRLSVFVRLMDAEYLKWWNKKHGDKSK